MNLRRSHRFSYLPELWALPLASFSLSLVGKSRQLLKEIAPEVSRVAVIISASNGAAPMYFRVVDAIAKSLAITPVKATFRTRPDIGQVIEAFASEPNGALYVPRDNFAETNRDLFIKLASLHPISPLSDHGHSLQMVGCYPTAAILWINIAVPLPTSTSFSAAKSPATSQFRNRSSSSLRCKPPPTRSSSRPLHT